MPLNLRLGKYGGRPLLAFPADRGNFSDKEQDAPIEKNMGVQDLPLS